MLNDVDKRSITFCDYYQALLPCGYNDKKRKLAVYGLGTTGRLFIDLCLVNNIEVDAVYVGKEYCNSVGYAGIDIIDIENIKNDSLILFYSIKAKMSEKIHDILVKKEKIVLIDISSVKIYKELLGFYYEEYFKSKQICLDKEDVIDFLGCRILNPGKKGAISWPEFLMEAGDIILPKIYGNYARIDEGSYEYNQVRIDRGDIVIDAGANVGCFSAIAAWGGRKFIPLNQ